MHRSNVSNTSERIYRAWTGVQTPVTKYLIECFFKESTRACFIKNCPVKNECSSVSHFNNFWIANAIKNHSKLNPTIAS